MKNPIIFTENQLPDFSSLSMETLVLSLKAVLKENYVTVESLVKQAPPFTWDNVMMPLEAMDDRLSRLWSVISHLNAVCSSSATREAYNACLPLLSDYAAWMSHNQALYQAIESIAEHASFKQLTLAQQQVIRHEIRDFRLAGVNLSREKQHTFADLQKRLSQLSAQFEENVLDATDAWTYLVTDKKQLAGLPASAIQTAEAFAKTHQKTGWLFSLQMPAYIAVMTYAEDRALRQRMHEAYLTRASDQGEFAGKWDNTQVMQEILSVRHQMALMLDFKHFADLSLATKMAESVPEVNDFLHELLERALPCAEKELAELGSFAQATDGITALQPWDVSYYSEKIKHQRYDLSQEALRAYFPVDQVLSGLFDLVSRLFCIKITETPNPEIWHPSVRFFSIDDAGGQRRGQFYLDLYARAGKRSGAWMDACHGRRKLPNGTLQLPVAHLVCNFSRPMGKKPALLTHDEVITLFHEFGHGLHHMLTQVDCAGVAGTEGVCWDAVELPSQFMENWCWQWEVLQSISRHVDTGEKLPRAWYEKMTAARHFHAALQLIRQLEFSLFDWQLHTTFDPEKPNQITAILTDVRKKATLVPTADYDRFAHSFSHIFAGGYGAGYYGYKWAEVLSCDAFAKFEEEGLFNPTVGQAFLQSILETGGSEDPMPLFKRFRGRAPDIDALLRYSGIAG